MIYFFVCLGLDITFSRQAISSLRKQCNWHETSYAHREMVLPKKRRAHFKIRNVQFRIALRPIPITLLAIGDWRRVRTYGIAHICIREGKYEKLCEIA